MKETYYFSHDYNSRNDEKIMFLLSKYKWEGYGIYWLLIELLHEATDNLLNTDLFDGIAFSYNIDITMLSSVITTCLEVKLFYKENNKIGSNRVNKNISELNDFRLKKSIAGKVGMAKRWGSDNTVITKHNKVKESKVKESKILSAKADGVSFGDEVTPYKELKDINL